MTAYINGKGWATAYCEQCRRECVLGPVGMWYCPEHMPLLPIFGPKPARAGTRWIGANGVLVHYEEGRPADPGWGAPWPVPLSEWSRKVEPERKPLRPSRFPRSPLTGNRAGLR